LRRFQVATNRPSWLLGRPRLTGLNVLASFPEGCGYGGAPPQGPPPDAPRMAFMVGGIHERGRALVLSDHSVFINSMMLQTDNDNFPFAYYCLKWLHEAKEPRDHVLFIDEGHVRTDLNIPLRPAPPVPVPSVAELNHMLYNMESADVFT